MPMPPPPVPVRKNKLKKEWFHFVLDHNNVMNMRYRGMRAAFAGTAIYCKNQTTCKKKMLDHDPTTVGGVECFPRKGKILRRAGWYGLGDQVPVYHGSRANITQPVQTSRQITGWQAIVTA